MNDFTLDSLFNDLFGDALTPSYVCRTYSASPKVDVKEEKNSYVLEMELPGRSENDVDIELDNNNLTISSKKDEKTEKKEAKDEKKSKYILKERKFGDFSRRFTLPTDVESSGINANFKNGILTVVMPKKDIPEPKRIRIEAC
ncbi:MAG: Hsp20/alpha crystallin family protein [Treponema sp.]|nr:Hsp20/alpha crystallin family protein [Treponema sp.]